MCFPNWLTFTVWCFSIILSWKKPSLQTVQQKNSKLQSLHLVLLLSLALVTAITSDRALQPGFPCPNVGRPNASPRLQLRPHQSLEQGTTTGALGTAGALLLDSTWLHAAAQDATAVSNRNSFQAEKSSGGKVGEWCVNFNGAHRWVGSLFQGCDVGHAWLHLMTCTWIHVWTTYVCMLCKYIYIYITIYVYAHRSAQMRVCLHEASYGYTNAFGCACACMSFCIRICGTTCKCIVWLYMHTCCLRMYLRMHMRMCMFMCRLYNVCVCARAMQCTANQCQCTSTCACECKRYMYMHETWKNRL